MDRIYRHYRTCRVYDTPTHGCPCRSAMDTARKKDYADFTQRLPRLIKFYQRDSMNYAKHIFDIQAEYTTTQEEDGSGSGAIVATLRTIDNAPIYYTLDGTEPTTASEQYNGTGIVIRQSADLRAVAIRPEGKAR